MANYFEMTHAAYDHDQPLKIEVEADIEQGKKHIITHIVSWWKSAYLYGTFSRWALEKYLHGAHCFCDEKLDEEIQFLLKIVRNDPLYVYGEDGQ